jgi:hypothetical protein
MASLPAGSRCRSVRIKDLAGPEKRDHVTGPDVFDGVRVSRRNIYYLKRLAANPILHHFLAFNMAHPDHAIPFYDEELFSLRVVVVVSAGDAGLRP